MARLQHKQTQRPPASRARCRRLAFLLLFIAAFSGLSCSGAASKESLPPLPGQRLLRVGYWEGDGYQYLDLDVSLKSTLPECPKAGGLAVRVYEVLDPGKTETVLWSEPRSVLWTAELWRQLTEPALAALRQSMGPPRRKLEWHDIALAYFWETPRPSGQPPQAPPLSLAERKQVLQALEGSEKPEVIAAPIYGAFPVPNLAEASEWLRGAADSDKIALRLVPLVYKARKGDKPSLLEILRLSLEYHTSLPVFETAVRTIFPETVNLELYREFPHGRGGPGAAAFLNAVQSGLGRATYLTEGGPEQGAPCWKLERPSSAPKS